MRSAAAGEGYKVQDPCAWVWVSVQTPEFLGNPQRKSLSHRTSLLQGPVQQQTPLISGNKGGRVSSSSKIAWGEGGVEGCEGSDVTSHIAAGAWSQLKPLAAAKSAWYEGNLKSKGKLGVVLLTEGSVTLRLKTVDNRVDACECGHLWLPQLFIMRWQPDKLWLWWLHQLPGPTSHSVFPDWLFLSDATHDGKSLWFLLGRIT